MLVSLYFLNHNVLHTVHVNVGLEVHVRGSQPCSISHLACVVATVLYMYLAESMGLCLSKDKWMVLCLYHNELNITV